MIQILKIFKNIYNILLQYDNPFMINRRQPFTVNTAKFVFAL